MSTVQKKGDSQAAPSKRGRPETRVIKLDATPEKAARAIFSAVKQPDPKMRKIEGRHE